MLIYIVTRPSAVLVARFYFPHGQSVLFPQRLHKAFDFCISVGHFGVVGSNRILKVSIYLANSILLNGDSLSEMI